MCADQADELRQLAGRSRTPVRRQAPDTERFLGAVTTSKGGVSVTTIPRRANLAAGAWPR